MAQNRQTIKPGILVGLSAKLAGGIKYARVDIAQEQHGQTRVAKWETTSTVIDQDEYTRAVKERGRVRNLVSGVCLRTAFGLICPPGREEALETAIRDASDSADAWNAQSTHNKISLYVLTGQIAKDDESAARAITREVRDLLQEMRSAVDAADPARIREACTAARGIGQMLSPELEESVSKAVASARSIARKIVKRVETAGESAAAVLAEINTAAIDQARFAFLDLAPQTPAELAAPQTPPADAARDLDDTGLEVLLFAGLNQFSAAELDDAEEEATAPAVLFHESTPELEA